MAFEFKSPKYLRKYVISQCIEQPARIETIARNFTISRLGPVPPLFSKQMNDYSKSMATDYKNVKFCCRELCKAGSAENVGEEQIKAVNQNEEIRREYNEEIET